MSDIQQPSWEEIEIGGKIWSIAEDEFAASFNHDKGQAFLNSLVEEYKLRGSRSLAKWARERLSQAFLSVDKRPIWVESQAPWPFLNGRPMVFIHQYAVPETSVSKEALTTGVVLYVFGARIPEDSGGVIMQYQVVSQYPELKRVR